jgi:hypothetical protein
LCPQKPHRSSPEQDSSQSQIFIPGLIGFDPGNHKVINRSGVSPGGKIDSAIKVALLQALVKAQRCLDVFQHVVSQNTQTAGAAERLSSLLLDIKELDPGQWGSLKSGVITTVFSLLYCCIMECYELRPTTLAISSLSNQLDACNLALQCVYGAAIMYVSVYLFDVNNLNILTRSAF